MIQLPQGFKIGTSEAIDSRLTLTKKEMKEMNDFFMPNVYIAICKENGELFLYNKTNELNENTGRFHSLSDQVKAFVSDSLALNNDEIDFIIEQAKLNQK